MARLTGHVTGKLCFREGEGVLMEIPQGPCGIEIGELDVTLTWVDDSVNGATAMPKSDYERYVADGVLSLE